MRRAAISSTVLLLIGLLGLPACDQRNSTDSPPASPASSPPAAASRVQIAGSAVSFMNSAAVSGLLEEQALEALAGVLDGALQGGGEVLVLGGHGQVHFQFGAQVKAATLSLDLVQVDGRLGFRGGAHGDNLLPEGTDHAHLPSSLPASLQPRAQTCDREGNVAGEAPVAHRWELVGTTRGVG